MTDWGRDGGIADLRCKVSEGLADGTSALPVRHTGWKTGATCGNRAGDSPARLVGAGFLQSAVADDGDQQQQAEDAGGDVADQAAIIRR